MPVKTFTDPDTGIVIQQLAGTLSARDHMESIHQLYLEERCPATTPVLWDGSQGTMTELTYPQMSNMADLPPDLLEAMSGGKTAIVPNTDADFGMARMFEALAQWMPRTFQVFRCRDEAIEWLLTEPLELTAQPHERP